MIDWSSVLLNSIWILGLTLLLAVYSQVSYLAARDRARNLPGRLTLRNRLAQPLVQRLCIAGFVLLFLSLAFLADSWWARLVAFSGLGVGVYAFGASQHSSHRDRG